MEPAALPNCSTPHQCLQDNARQRCCFLKKISSISKAGSSSPVDKGQQLSVVTVGQKHVNSRNNLNCYQFKKVSYWPSQSYFPHYRGF